MNLLHLLDLPSSLLFLSSLLLGFLIGGTNLHKSFSLNRDNFVPLGAAVSLIVFILILVGFENPLTLGSALTVALLPSIYGLLLFSLLEALVPNISSLSNPSLSINRLLGKAIIGCILLVGMPIIAVNLVSNPLYFVNFSSVIAVLFGSPLLSFLAHKTQKTEVRALGKYSLLLASIVILFSLSLLFYRWDAPAAIAPAMGVGLLTLVYGGVLYSLSYVLQGSFYDKPLTFAIQDNLTYLLTILFLGVSFFLLVIQLFG